MEQENNQNSQSIPSVDSFNAMPEPKVFETLPNNLQGELLEKFQDQQVETKTTKEEKDQEKTDSEEETQDSNEEETEENKEVEDTEEEVNEEKKEPSVEDRLSQIEKSYKSLLPEYTKSRQAIRDLKIENDQLKAKLAGSLKSEPDKADSTIEELEQLKKQVKPEAQPFVESLIKAVQKIVEKQVGEKTSKIEQQLTAKDQSANVSKFQEEVKSFLDGELKELEPEMDALVAELYPSEDELIQAASKDSKLFKELFKELKDRHEDKYLKIRTRAKIDPKNRNKEIKDTGVSGKSKTSKQTSDPYDVKEFGKKSLPEQEKLLREAGVFKD
ncbi:MAG: hypothetical protein ACHQ1D_00825 [Nitrososphaerales archaeon]